MSYGPSAATILARSNVEVLLAVRSESGKPTELSTAASVRNIQSAMKGRPLCWPAADRFVVASLRVTIRRGSG
jgi:hypothetical protein